MEQLNPNDAFLKFAIAQEFSSQKKFDDATKYYHLLLEKFPDYLPTYYHFAKLKEEQHDYSTAINLYNKGIELAKTQGDKKTLSELQQAIFLIE